MPPIAVPPPTSLSDAPAPAAPDVFVVDDSHLITEDDQPVDGFCSEQQMRLLVESLCSSWEPGRPFLAAANVGVFYVAANPPIVPDVLLSMDVQRNPDRESKAGKSYLMWEKGKPPNVVIEIVSNREGDELTRKREIYAKHVRAGYYVVWDPLRFLGDEPLTVFELGPTDYRLRASARFPELGLGLTIWSGEYEGMNDVWLRWTDASGNLIPTGREGKRAEAARVDAARAKLREMGIDPASVGL